MNRPRPTPTASDASAARPTPTVSVVIVNYNAWPDVAALVGSLAAAPEVAAGLGEVVVVDNASEGPVPEILLHPPAGVRFEPRGDNGGFAVGVNAGTRIARAPWVLLLNPDVVVPDGWLGRVVARLGSEPASAADARGIVGFGLRNADGSPQPSVGRFPSLGRAVWEQLIPRSRRKYQAVWRTRAGPVDWVTGACVLVNARLLDELGGLDEDFFLYYEEVALCRAAARRGWRVEYDPDPGVAVAHLRPLQDRDVSPRLRVITRHSKLLYFRKHLPRWQFLGLCLVVAWEARLKAPWAAAFGRLDEAAAWRVIGGVARDLRAGVNLGGRDVLARADAALALGRPGSSCPA